MIRYEDKTQEYASRAEFELDQLLAEMAGKIMALAVKRAPLSATKAKGGKGSRGSLRDSIKVEKQEKLRYIIKAGGGIRNVEYAAYQERGMRADGTRVVQNYTTSGTGAHYMENSAKQITQQMKSRLRAIFK